MLFFFFFLMLEMGSSQSSYRLHLQGRLDEPQNRGYVWFKIPAVKLIGCLFLSFAVLPVGRFMH